MLLKCGTKTLLSEAKHAARAEAGGTSDINAPTSGGSADLAAQASAAVVEKDDSDTKMEDGAIVPNASTGQLLTPVSNFPGLARST